jgi:hypothetical protein
MLLHCFEFFSSEEGKDRHRKLSCRVSSSFEKGLLSSRTTHLPIRQCIFCFNSQLTC